MIENLSIKNFSIIRDIEINFTHGLNVIHGESGSGKSLILYALNSLLGEPCSSSVIREGEKKSIITSLISNKYFQRIITENKSISSIDGENTTLKNIKIFREENVQFHFQGSQENLYNSDYIINFIDSFISYDILNELSISYDNYIFSKNEYELFIKNNEVIENKIEFYKFQLKDIEEINLQLNEDIKLENDILNYHNFSKQLSIQDNCKNEIQKIIQSCNDLSNQLNNEYDNEFENFLSFINDLEIKIDKNIKELNQISEMSINELNQRLYDIQKLKKRLSKKTIEEIFTYKDFLINEINNYENKDDYGKKLEETCLQNEKKYLDLCDTISGIRKNVSSNIKIQLLNILLNKLKFDYVDIDIQFNKLNKYTYKGLDDVDILISFNKGFTPMPIRNIISGGEASRLALSFKLLKNDNKVLVLDEIETGLSGNTLIELSNTLKEISVESQIICITHSKEIIDNADNKIEVYKSTTQDKVETKIKTS